MIQYMVAASIAQRVPGCTISNVVLPDWNIAHPPVPSAGGPALAIPTQKVDIEAVAEQLRSGAIERVEITGFGQWMANFPSLDDCRRMFPNRPDQYPGYDDTHLVCNVRGGETLDARHPQYTLLPIGFYRDLAAATGLRLVFMGQIEDNAYCNDLRAAFPGAVFRPSEGAIPDFETFRNSHHLVPAISTFSWLAAWLSQAATIHLAVNGLFSPVQNREADLIPANDDRYRFHLFPVNYAVPVDAYRNAHAALNGGWRLVPPRVVVALRDSPRWPRPVADYAAMFDPAFYIEEYPDIADALRNGVIDTPWAHFAAFGLFESRKPFRFDVQWYAQTYPMAAFEVGQGDYADMIQHYLCIGRDRGYRPNPA